MWIRITNTPVTTRLVHYRLLSAAHFARRPLRKPLLQQRHCQARFAWEEQHLNWRVGHWQHESRFLLYRENGRIRVRRQAHEVLTDQTLLPRVQAGGGGVTARLAVHTVLVNVTYMS